MRSQERRPVRVWTVPIIIGLATLVGLLGALVADGLWDVLATLLVFSTLAYATVLGLRSA